MKDFSTSLHTHFGFTSFRAGQAEAIQSLLNKQHTLAIMPTGAGKSLIYQFTALQLEGLTLVIAAHRIDERPGGLAQPQRDSRHVH